MRAHEGFRVMGTPRFCLEGACTACANPRAVRLPAFSRPLSRGFPLVDRAPVLGLWCADGTSSTQQTSSTLSRHRQIRHSEEARERGRRVHNPMHHRGTAGRKGLTALAGVAREQAASGGSVLPLEDNEAARLTHRPTDQHKGAHRETSRSPSCRVRKKRVCSCEGPRPVGGA
jgi:hypothetical protein